MSGEYRSPPQSSQRIYASGKKFISSFILPAPLQVSQRPPLTLKEKAFGPRPLTFASGREDNNERIRSQAPMYVAGDERGVLPIGLWSTSITFANRFPLRTLRKGALAQDS